MNKNWGLKKRKRKRGWIEWNGIKFLTDNFQVRRVWTRGWTGWSPSEHWCTLYSPPCWTLSSVLSWFCSFIRVILELGNRSRPRTMEEPWTSWTAFSIWEGGIIFPSPAHFFPFSSENRALSLSIIDQLVISVLLRRHVKGTHEPFPRNFPTIKVESFARRGTSNARLVPLCSTTGKEYETYLRLFFIDLYPSPFVREGRMTKSNILWATILWETGR